MSKTRTRQVEGEVAAVVDAGEKSDQAARLSGSGIRFDGFGDPL
jgi:hypothetical protein